MNKLLRLYVKMMYSVKGATAIEYAILVTLIAVVIIAAVTLIGVRVELGFSKAAAALPST